MAKRYTDAFCCDAVRMATTCGLTRPQLSSDLGVGLSTLNKRVQQHEHDDRHWNAIGPRDNGDARMKTLKRKTPAFAKKSVCCVSRGKC